MTDSQALKWFKNELKDGKCSKSCEQCNASERALFALEKQIPMKPKRVDDGSFYWFECPVCGEGAMPSENCYCGFCGQKLDWSDEE